MNHIYISSFAHYFPSPLFDNFNPSIHLILQPVVISVDIKWFESNVGSLFIPSDEIETSPRSMFRFMDLPLEIREEIYLIALQTYHKDKKRRRHAGRQAQSNSALCIPDEFRASPQIQREAWAVLFRNIAFEVDDIDFENLPGSQRVRQVQNLEMSCVVEHWLKRQQTSTHPIMKWCHGTLVLPNTTPKPELMSNLKTFYVSVTIYGLPWTQVHKKGASSPPSFPANYDEVVKRDLKKAAMYADAWRRGSPNGPAATTSSPANIVFQLYSTKAWAEHQYRASFIWNDDDVVLGQLVAEIKQILMEYPKKPELPATSTTDSAPEHRGETEGVEPEGQLSLEEATSQLSLSPALP